MYLQIMLDFDEVIPLLSITIAIFNYTKKNNLKNKKIRLYLFLKKLRMI